MDRASNFDHLEALDAGLAAFGRFAERYFVDDANTALIKTRQFGERLATLIAEQAALPIQPKTAFVDVLRALQVDGAAPREVLDVLHKLRRSGNEAAHDAQGERRDAFEAIKLCHRLGVWWHATRRRNPNLTIAFIPPRAARDDAAELKGLVEELQARLAEVETVAERHQREAKEAWDARLTAEEKTRVAEEERAVYEALALEAEQRATPAPTPAQQVQFVAAAAQAARNLDLDEADTRLLIDDQLRQAGWEADTTALRHALGTRPERGRRIAIAEWPTASGPADYALFIGEEMVGLVEAKRKRRDVAAALDQAERYSRGVSWADGGSTAGGPWGEHHAPFVFSTNGRSYYPQFATQSGIWFRDVRRPANGARALEGWPTPEGLAERLEVNQEAAEAALRDRDFDFGFALRPYQVNAIRAVETALESGRREMLVAMATGTGKTKLSIALIYRLLEAKRFLRVCFVVDRSALGEQAERAFDTTRMVGAKTFAEIFGLKGLGDRDIGRDAKVHVCTVQSLVQRVLARSPEERPPVDQYDLILIDECHFARTLVVTYKDVEDAFAALPGVETAHFNAIAGLDLWRDVDLLIVVGRPLPGTGDLDRTCAALFGHVPDGRYRKAARGIRMRSGLVRAVRANVHPDPTAETLRAAICDDELIQAIGRGRGVNRTAADRLEVHVLADVALPLVHDRLSCWELEAPDVMQRMLLAGVATDSPSDAVALHPSLFGDAEQAKKQFQRGPFKGQTPIRGTYREMSLKSTGYRRPGRGRGWQRCWWIDGDAAAAKAALECAIGPLAEWRAD